MGTVDIAASVPPVMVDFDAPTTSGRLPPTRPARSFPTHRFIAILFCVKECFPFTLLILKAEFIEAAPRSFPSGLLVLKVERALCPVTGGLPGLPSRNATATSMPVRGAIMPL